MDDQKQTESTSASPSQPGGIRPTVAVLREQIETRFAYHTVDADGVKAMGEIREACKTTALIIADRTSICRDQSSALTHLEQAMFYANAAISRKGR